MFSKAPVRRFNDQPDSTPPPGAYDPKFKTDVSQCSKAPAYHVSSNTSLKNKTPSINNLAGSRPSSPVPSFARLRSVSFQRSSADKSIRRNSSQPPLNRARTFISTSSRGKLSSLQSNGNTSDYDPNNETPSLTVVDNSASINVETLNLTIYELHKQLADIGKELASEKEKIRRFQEGKVTQDNMVKLLQSEVDKHEAAKAEWEMSEKAFTETIEMLQKSNEDLQKLLAGFQTKFMPLIEEKDSLKQQIVNLQKDKMEFQMVEKQLQDTILTFQKVANDKDLLLHESEQKCQLLVENMESCYRISNEKMQKAEVDKEEWVTRESKLQETIKLAQEELEGLRLVLEKEKFTRELKEKELEELQLVLEQEKSTRDIKEKELELTSTSSQTSPIKTDDEDKYKNKINALGRQWAAKENSYLQRIVELEKKVDLESKSTEFANKAAEMIQEITETKLQNEKLQEGINKINILKNLEGESASMNDSPQDFASDLALGEQQCLHLCHGAPIDGCDLTMPVPTDPEEFNRKLNELKSMEKTFALKAEEEKQKRTNTINVLGNLLKENAKLKIDINLCSKILEMDNRSGSIPENNILETLDNNNNNETFTLGERDTQDLGDLSSRGNKILVHDTEVVQIFQKNKKQSTLFSGTDPDFTKFRASPSTSGTSSPLRRSLSNTQRMPEKPLKQGLMQSVGNSRRKIIPMVQSGGNTNLSSAYLDDVPEEDTD